jgi:hypothetical protein
MKGHLDVHIVLTFWRLFDFIYKKLSKDDLTLLDNIKGSTKDECAGDYDKQIIIYFFTHSILGLILFYE